MITTLCCLNCGESFNTEDKVALSELPPCSECDGELTIPGNLTIGCCNCDFRKTVSNVNCKDYPYCPNCEWQVIVLTQEYINETKLDETFLKTDQTVLLPPKSHKETLPVTSNAEELPTTGLRSDSFGKYKILEEVARGGMGIIYKVEDPDLKRPLALKVLIAGEGASEELLKRFMREARSAAKLNNPNIVPIHEVGEISGQYFFTMDFIPGPSFDKIISGEFMKHNEMITHMRDIALALKVAHDNGIIHRDIKPANIIYDIKNERAMLTDFGLAKDMESNTMLSMTGIMMGSPAYMSPEQARGFVHELDDRTDIYSLGVVLYECVTGEQPFQGNTIVETVRKAVFDDPVPPRQLSPDSVNKDLQNIILKCMEKEPQNRYQSMQELADDLTAYLYGNSVEAKSQPILVRNWRKLRKKPLLFGLFIATPFVLLGSIIALWYIFWFENFLDGAKIEINSGISNRQSAIITQISAKIKAKKFTDIEKKRITKLLMIALKSNSDKVVEQTILLLELHGDIDVVNELIALVDNVKKSDKIRSAALATLRYLGTKKGVDKKSISQSFIKLANDRGDSRNLRIAAIWSLEDVWGDNVLPDLIKIAEDRSEESAIRIAALRTCGTKIAIGSNEMNAIIKLYSDDDEQVAKTAEEVLKESRNKSSILALYGIKNKVVNVSDKLGQTMLAVADNQRRLMEMVQNIDGPTSKEITPIQAMTIKLKDKNVDIRMSAAYDLGALGDVAALPILIKTLTDSDGDVISIAAKSIIRLSKKQKPKMDRIVKLLQNKRSIVREQAVYIISQLSETNSYNDVIDIINSELNMRVIREIAKLLVKLPPEKALPLLAQLLDKSIDENYPATKESIHSMVHFGESAAPFLIKFIDTKNSNIKKLIINGLEEVTGRNYGDDTKRWKKWNK